ncbi:MAG: hypothetical protein IJJ75_06580, partial [Firmicutes bacterium]|nr:hypothetical protein [Bacillota bacterium]
GPSGSYLDHVQEIRRMGIDISRLVDLNISELRIRSILEESGFTSYRLEGAFEWIRQCVRLIRQI